jgi:L-seryl-tRNA(Ser) seleniumtransferase
MSIHELYGLTQVINARGTFTPLGVSRSSPQVGKAVAAALGDFFVIDELLAALSRQVAEATGAEAATVTHCAAAGITLAVAAAMTGSDPRRIAALPDGTGMATRVVIPAGHAVDYGHPIQTDVRLAGATPVLAGSDEACGIGDIESALAHERTACLLLVSSRLVSGAAVDLPGAVAAARRRGVPTIIDGAAQDLRVGRLLETGADLVVLSAQKYLAAPTAGLVVGRACLVEACRAQDRGIGRAMKPTKEAVVGVLAALQERRSLDLDRWAANQQSKVAAFVKQAARIGGLHATMVPDSTGLPFSRACLIVDPVGVDWSAAALARHLRDGDPPIWLMDHEAGEGRLFLELVPLDEGEVREILRRLAALAAAHGREPV